MMSYLYVQHLSSEIADTEFQSESDYFEEKNIRMLHAFESRCWRGSTELRVPDSL